MKKFIIVIVLIAGGLGVLHYFGPGGKYQNTLPDAIKNFSSSTLLSELKNIGAEVSAPTPLRNNKTDSQSVLTKQGIINFTNLERKNNGNLAALHENLMLDAAALAKAQDIFKQQYFEHINPQGKGPADLARAAGYTYISIGENLAMGFFEGDEDLVKAWMNSPGHRANILNNKYQEIGVAAIKGEFEGRQTWVAVQEFGRPASSCPSVESGLRTEIDSLQAQINQLQSQLAIAKSQIEAMDPKTQEERDKYNQKVVEYNNLIKIYNNKVDSLKITADRYNFQVSNYNACLGS